MTFDDDPMYTYYDWLDAVEFEGTLLGYWDWVDLQYELDWGW